MKKIVTLGEIMLRLTPPGNKRFLQAESLDVTFGGGEANVAVSLAGYGYNAEFVTKLPPNPIGDCAVAALRKMNVKTDNIIRGGDRIGIYFLESGSAMRPSNVVYDRANSAISTAKAEEFDFDRIFDGADWFHISGITPAISKSAAEITEKALIAAKQKNITISFDINFRSKLWTVDEAAKTMKKLVPYVDVCFGNKWDAKNIMGLDIPDDASVKDACKIMSDAFGFKYIISSMRESRSASDNGWSACIYSAETDELYTSKKYNISPIVDRGGAGDSFAGGVICGLLDGNSFQDALEFGVAASALKHTIPGDFNNVTRAETEALAGGDASGRVRR